MTAPEVRAGSEFRVAGRTLTGTVLRYGDEAVVTLKDGRMVRERFSPGAFSPVPDVPLVMQHDESLVIAKAGEFVLNDSRRAMTIRAELRADSAALQLVKLGALGGYSFRFWPKEERVVGGVREIASARMGHVGLVDAGAYPGSRAEVRRGGGGGRGSRGGRLTTFRGRIPKGKRLECRCSPGDCTEALFERGSFDSLVDDADKRDVLGVVGDFSQAIGSRNRGTVRFWENRKTGDLEYALDIPNSDRGKALMDTFDSADVFGRPVIDVGASDVAIEGTLARYTKARVRAITVGATDAAKGWDALDEVAESASELAQKAAKLAGLSRPARRRSKVWLP